MYINGAWETADKVLEVTNPANGEVIGTVPAVAGMVVGIGFTASYIIGAVFFGMPKWCFGIGPQGIGTIGMLINFAVTLGLTPLTAPPAPEIRELVERIREPEAGS